MEKDILFHNQLVLIHCNDLGFRVHLNSGCCFRGVLHNPKHTLKRSFPNRNSLADQPVSSQRFRWGHWIIRTIPVLHLHGRVGFSISCSGSSTFRGNSCDIDTSGNKDTCILWLSAVMNEDKRSVDVDNDS